MPTEGDSVPLRLPLSSRAWHPRSTAGSPGDYYPSRGWLVAAQGIRTYPSKVVDRHSSNCCVGLNVEKGRIAISSWPVRSWFLHGMVGADRQSGLAHPLACSEAIRLPLSPGQVWRNLCIPLRLRIPCNSPTSYKPPI